MNLEWLEKGEARDDFGSFEKRSSGQVARFLAGRGEELEKTKITKRTQFSLYFSGIFINGVINFEGLLRN